jgi:hypothetical protein
LDGIPSTVKAALTRSYKEERKSRMVRAADLVTLPGKKAPKKRVAVILEPSDDGLREENGDALAESEEENSSDIEDMGKCYLFENITDHPMIVILQLSSPPPPPPKKKKNMAGARVHNTHYRSACVACVFFSD